MIQLIFVYGTLKRTYGNSRIIEEHPFVSEGIVRGYKAYDCGFPVARESKEDSLVGEVYDIEGSKKTLARLDSLESEGYMYFRRPVKVETPIGIFDAEMYVGNEQRWRFDDSKISHLRECPKNAQGHYEWTREKWFGDK